MNIECSNVERRTKYIVMACVIIVGDENGSGPAPIATAIITRAHVHVCVCDTTGLRDS